MAAPSVTVYKDAFADAGTSATTRVLTQRTVATGDVVAVVWQDENWATSGGSGGTNTPTVAQTAGTATIGIVTKQQDAGTLSHFSNALFTFTVTAGGTLTLTVGWTIWGSYTHERNTAWTFVATGCGGVGNTAMTTTLTTTITASLATSVHSYVIAMASDWAATGGATTTLTPAGFTLDAHETDGVVDQSTAGGVFSSRGGHWPDVSAGTVSYGVNVPTSAGYNLVVRELLASTVTPAPATIYAAAAVFPAPIVEQDQAPAAAITAGTAAVPVVAVTTGLQSGPRYATAAADLGGGGGTWASPANAQGTADATYAVWSIP